MGFRWDEKQCSVGGNFQTTDRTLSTSGLFDANAYPHMYLIINLLCLSLEIVLFGFNDFLLNNIFRPNL